MTQNPNYERMTAKLDAAIASSQTDGVMLTCGADLTPEPISWLWPGWLAQGKLHILAGAPGQGKTTIAQSFAATVTTGGRWPDGHRCEPGNVLIWSGEDDPPPIPCCPGCWRLVLIEIGFTLSREPASAARNIHSTPHATCRRFSEQLKRLAASAC